MVKELRKEIERAKRGFYIRGWLKELDSERKCGKAGVRGDNAGKEKEREKKGWRRLQRDGETN